MATPITPTLVRQLMSNDGSFSHEMKVGAVLHAFPQLNVKHGGTYSDPVTKRPRQFDYRATCDRDPRFLALAIECKCISPDFPMVVCGSGRNENESFHHLVLSAHIHKTEGTTRRLEFGSKTLAVHADDPFYPVDGFCGKSISRFKDDGKSSIKLAPDEDIYDKWSQALSSSVGLVNRAAGLTNYRRVTAQSAILPIVVVPDNTLWVCEFDEGGALVSDPTKSDEVRLFVGRRVKTGIGNYLHDVELSHVHFCTLGGFRDLVAGLINSPSFSPLFEGAKLIE